MFAAKYIMNDMLINEITVGDSKAVVMRTDLCALVMSCRGAK